jgi:hypothetical protein
MVNEPNNDDASAEAGVDKAGVSDLNATTDTNRNRLKDNRQFMSVVVPESEGKLATLVVAITCRC